MPRANHIFYYIILKKIYIIWLSEGAPSVCPFRPGGPNELGNAPCFVASFFQVLSHLVSTMVSKRIELRLFENHKLQCLQWILACCLLHEYTTCVMLFCARPLLLQDLVSRNSWQAPGQPVPHFLCWHLLWQPSSVRPIQVFLTTLAFEPAVSQKTAEKKTSTCQAQSHKPTWTYNVLTSCA